MVGMPDEDRVDLMLKISDFYKEQAERQWPDLSLEVVTQNRRNFVVAIMRRISDFDVQQVARHPKSPTTDGLSADTRNA